MPVTTQEFVSWGVDPADAQVLAPASVNHKWHEEFKTRASNTPDMNKNRDNMLGWLKKEMANIDKYYQDLTTGMQQHKARKVLQGHCQAIAKTAANLQKTAGALAQHFVNEERHVVAGRQQNKAHGAKLAAQERQQKRAAATAKK